MNAFSAGRTSGGNPTFLDLPPEYSDRMTAGAAIIPVPYDLTSSWVKGADRGPQAILEASHYVELYDTETRSEPYLRGLATLDPVQCSDGPERLADLVAQRVGEVADRGQVPIVLGGEHSVTIGAVAAMSDRCREMTVVQIDAHADTRESYLGSRFNHACVMARARERCPIVQVGIRSVDSEEVPRLDPERVFYAHQVVGRDDSWMDRVAELLTPETYLTVDLDAFDPAIIPATGTPEPGGLSWYEVVTLIDRIAAASKVVAFDVVELCPMEGHHASAFTAAKLVHRVWAAVLLNQK